MFSAIRKRMHLTPSTAIAFLALVFALTGGAFAASSHGGPGSGATASSAQATVAKSKAKPKAKAGPKGPAGLKGATGATGAPGPGGPAGTQGPAGAQGTQGTAGVNGVNGEAGKEGKEGKEGKQGKEGPPGAIQPGETLPSEATETGVWGDPQAGMEGTHNYAISFAVPLAKAPQPVLVKWEEEEVAGKCPGRGPEGNSPKAEPGYLCVYDMVEEGHVSKSPPPEFFGKFERLGSEWVTVLGASAVGTFIHVNFAGGLGEMAGSWAVTAE